MTFEERLLHDRILGQGEDPNDPVVWAKYKKEYDEEQAEKDDSSVCAICTNKQLHDIFITILDLFYKSEKFIQKPSHLADLTFDQIISRQAITFTMNLVAADGILSAAEANLLNEVFEMNYTPAEYAQFYREQDEKATFHGALKNFFVPTIVRAATALDNAVFNGEEKARALVLKFYSELGKAAISIDGEIDEEEAKSLNAFVTSLQMDDLTDTGGFIIVCK